MSDVNNKLRKFRKAILNDALEQKNKILNEISEYKRKELEITENHVLSETYEYIQKKKTEIHNEYNRQISLAQLESKRKLISERNRITDQVFSDTRTKLLAFCQNDDYKKYLQDALDSALDGNYFDHPTFYLKPEHMNFAQDVRNHYGRPCEVIADDSIEIGGFKVVSQKDGIVIDETLDTKLELERDEFITYCGLTLE